MKEFNRQLTYCEMYLEDISGKRPTSGREELALISLSKRSAGLSLVLIR